MKEKGRRNYFILFHSYFLNTNLTTTTTKYHWQRKSKDDAVVLTPLMIQNNCRLLGEGKLEFPGGGGAEKHMNPK